MWSWRRVVATKVSGTLSDCSLKNCVFSQKKHGAMACCLGKTPEISEVILGTVAIGSSPCYTWVGEIDSRDLNSRRALNPSRTSTDLVNIENTHIFFLLFWFLNQSASWMLWSLRLCMSLHPLSHGQGDRRAASRQWRPVSLFPGRILPRRTRFSRWLYPPSNEVWEGDQVACFGVFLYVFRAPKVSKTDPGIFSRGAIIALWSWLMDFRLTSVSSAFSYSHWK